MISWNSRSSSGAVPTAVCDGQAHSEKHIRTEAVFLRNFHSFHNHRSGRFGDFSRQASENPPPHQSLERGWLPKVAFWTNRWPYGINPINTRNRPLCFKQTNQKGHLWLFWIARSSRSHQEDAEQAVQAIASGRGDTYGEIGPCCLRSSSPNQSFQASSFSKTDRCFTWGSDGFLQRRIPGKNGEVSSRILLSIQHPSSFPILSEGAEHLHKTFQVGARQEHLSSETF